MIETVNESVVTIEPKIVMAGGWGDITGDIADQADLIVEFAKKMDIVPIVLPDEANIDTVIANGVYKIDTRIIAVHNSSNLIRQMVYLIEENSTIQRSSTNNGVTWSAFSDLASTSYVDFFISEIDNKKVDKVTGKELALPPAYASIYLDNGNTAQTIPTGVNYTKITAYNTNGLSANCTPDAANDKIKITASGVYDVTYTASYTADVNNVTFRGAVFLGGVEQGNIHSGGQMGLQGAMRSTACVGLINITTVPIDLDVRVRHDNGGNVAITHVYANLNIKRIG